MLWIDHQIRARVVKPAPLAGRRRLRRRVSGRIGRCPLAICTPRERAVATNSRAPAAKSASPARARVGSIAANYGAWGWRVICSIATTSRAPTSSSTSMRGAAFVATASSSAAIDTRASQSRSSANCRSASTFLHPQGRQRPFQRTRKRHRSERQLAHRLDRRRAILPAACHARQESRPSPR
jgi:hypothetical protein